MRHRTVALACSGLGRVHRGFEAFAASLFDALRADVDMILYKGHGPRGRNEVVVPNVPRSLILRLGFTRDAGQAYRWEQLSFALALTPRLLFRRHAIVHYMDGALAAVLLRVRRVLRLDFVLLFKNGGAHTPDTYARIDYVQVVTPLQYREALAHGIPDNRLFMIPLAVDCESLHRRPDCDAAALRAQYRIPASAWVIASVAALNKSDKRLDWIIREVARLDMSDAFLLMVGQDGPETPALQHLARELLPGRHAFAFVPHQRVREIYWLSDIFALGSLREGFGLAVAEAACAGTPVVVHDSEHFQWLVPHPASHVDMTTQGCVADRLQTLRANPDLQREMVIDNLVAARSRFSWDVLRPQYIQMYNAVRQRADQESAMPPARH